MHLSCVDTNTVSKWKEEKFHMSHVTEGFHLVRPKWFLSLWYIRCKPCTYLAWKLALSSNKIKWAFTWASSPRSTIKCVQNIFWAVIWHQLCIYLAPTVTLSPKRKKWDSTWLTSPKSSIGFIQNDFWDYSTLDAKPCTYLASWLALSPKGLSFHPSLIT
jgi:hypothetical protein